MEFRKLRKAPDCREKLSEQDVDGVMKLIQIGLLNEGYECNLNKLDGTAFSLSGCHLSDKRVEEKGYNISPHSGRRGRHLGWKDWLKVNEVVNERLDMVGVCANVKSLHGKFVVREGKKVMTEEDWQEQARENVGSMISPVEREEAWRPEAED